MSDMIPDVIEEFDPPEENMDRSMLGPPHNRMAEEAVIGSMLLDPTLFNELIAFLKPEDFYIRRNGMIWEAFEYLLEQKIDPDIVTISDYLERNKVFSEIGGLAYLTELVNNTTTTMNATHYAVIVHNNAIRRRMINTANLLAKLAFDEEKEIVQILDEAEKSVFNLSENRTKRDLAPLGRILGDVYKQINKLSTRDADVTGVPTGLNMLDKFLGGLQKSDLLIVAGRPGMGKTGFLLTAAKNAALIHKKNVAYFSLEMANEQLAQRLLAQATGIDMKNIRNGRLGDDDWERLIFVINDMTGARLYLDDTPAITPLQLLAKCRRLDAEQGIDLIIVDYLQLMSSGHRNENRVQEVSYISRSLKMLAKEIGVPVLAAAQLSRAVEQREGRRPILSDLRESGSLEQDADIVMFIHRQDDKEGKENMPEMAELIISKNRNGPTHTQGIKLNFRPSSASFEDYQLGSLER